MTPQANLILIFVYSLYRFGLGVILSGSREVATSHQYRRIPFHDRSIVGRIHYGDTDNFLQIFQ